MSITIRQARPDDASAIYNMIYELAVYEKAPQEVVTTPDEIRETLFGDDSKTEALIFGSHDSSTLEMTQKISNYLDILWGAETIPWSMYYLNGLDNSLILVSTLPLKDLSSSFKESTISSVVESRRAEMLLQANTLDERETFSSLRHLTWQNGHYFTLRTTFNQPGHLATVVAFDLPINDLIPRACRWTASVSSQIRRKMALAAQTKKPLITLASALMACVLR